LTACFDMPESLFPIAQAEAYFRQAFASVERRGSVIRWPHCDGVTEFRVEAIEHRTHDKLLVNELVTLEHSSDAIAAADTTWAAHLNKWATLSALLAADGEHPARLVCKVGIFSTDREAAERVYAPLMCTEAAIIGWHAAMIARHQYRIDSEQSPLNGTDDPPPFALADFEAAKEFTDRLGLIASVSDGNFACEFSWDPAPTSNLFRHHRKRPLKSGQYTPDELGPLSGRIILFRMTTTEPHPLYGNGVLCGLELPLPPGVPNSADLVDQLNRWEFQPDFAPLYGAWCTGPRAPTFVTFVPNQCCLPGLLQSLTAWSHQRALRVQGFLEQGEGPG